MARKVEFTAEVASRVPTRELNARTHIGGPRWSIPGPSATSSPVLTARRFKHPAWTDLIHTYAPTTPSGFDLSTAQING